MSKFVVTDTVRWKVVKLQHKLKDDMDVAKLLLDCYDAIISGCLQWESERTKTRLPPGTSDKGWKLLEEIMYMSQWCDRQEDRWQALTVWNDDDDCDDKDKDDDNNAAEDTEDIDESKEQVHRGRGLVVEPVQKTVTANKRKSNKSKKVDMTECITIKFGDDDNAVYVDLTQSEETADMAMSTSSSDKPKTPKGPPKKHTKRNASVRFLSDPKQALVIKCKRCLNEVSSISEFKEHYASHTDTVIIEHEVRKLTTITLEEIPLLADIMVPCPDCNELQDASKFEIHRLNKHFLRICNLCGGQYTSFGGWSRHMKIHKAKETGVKPHVCDKCGASFSLIGTLTTHKKLHSIDRPHICDICGKGFKLSSRLKRHLQIHNKTSWSCEYCNKTFNYKFNLKTHLRVHTHERPFQCVICEKSYSHNQSLKVHAKTEHGIDIENAHQPLQEFAELSSETSVILRDGTQYV